jgi:hypothetical protein
VAVAVVQLQLLDYGLSHKESKENGTRKDDGTELVRAKLNDNDVRELLNSQQ